MANRLSSTLLQRPGTRLGWWGFGLAVTYIVLNLVSTLVLMRLTTQMPLRESIMPFFGIFMVLCGLAAGIVGLIGVLRNHERSWAVWMSLLVGVSVLVLIFGEFLIAH